MGELTRANKRNRERAKEREREMYLYALVAMYEPINSTLYQITIDFVMIKYMD